MQKVKLLNQMTHEQIYSHCGTHSNDTHEKHKRKTDGYGRYQNDNIKMYPQEYWLLIECLLKEEQYGTIVLWCIINLWPY